MLHRSAKDYDEVAEDIETGAIEIRHAELLDGLSLVSHADAGAYRSPSVAARTGTGSRVICLLLSLGIAS